MIQYKVKRLSIQKETNTQTVQLIMTDSSIFKTRIVGNLAPDYVFTQGELEQHFNDGTIIDSDIAQRLSYADVADQLEMWANDMEKGTTTFREHRAEIKALFPKPQG
jgi:hypothetical protein